jgi:hypothetical protein
MSSTCIVCNDTVGLTFGNTLQTIFYVNTANTINKEKLLKECFKQIIETSNLKEPYFFFTKDVIKTITIGNHSKHQQTMHINLFPSAYYRIYKLKIKGIVNEPICVLCCSSDTFNDVVIKLKKKYKNISGGEFKYNIVTLKNDTPLNTYNFNTGTYCYNEITFEKKITEQKNTINNETIDRNSIKKSKNKKKIPVTVKNKLWSIYFGDIMTGICQCCFTTPIHFTNFDCGHIISEYDGGSISIDNLKPICRTCNSSMGTQNMEVYIKKYGFKKT